MSKGTHTYQRERASITGLRLNLRKIMKTGRLIGVAVSRLVSPFLFDARDQGVEFIIREAVDVSRLAY
jgi:hypothetical protein